MEREPYIDAQKESIGNVKFEIVEKNEKAKEDVMSLLHEYPNHFVHGIFEGYAEKDFKDSDIAIAYDNELAVGCLMFNRTTNEYTWLAVKKDITLPKAELHSFIC